MKKAEDMKRKALPKFFYKECAVVGNRYFSISNGKTEFKGGVVLVKERPRRALIDIYPHKNLNLLAHLVFDSESTARQQAFPYNSILPGTPRVILKFKVGGKYHYFAEDESYWFERIQPVALKRWYRRSPTVYDDSPDFVGLQLDQPDLKQSLI
ncbi:hypothetical protein AAMO2058_001448800 [Amorphochlora amoebiformis]